MDEPSSSAFRPNGSGPVEERPLPPIPSSEDGAAIGSFEQSGEANATEDMETASSPWGSVCSKEEFSPATVDVPTTTTSVPGNSTVQVQTQASGETTHDQLTQFDLPSPDTGTPVRPSTTGPQRNDATAEFSRLDGVRNDTGRGGSPVPSRGATLVGTSSGSHVPTSEPLLEAGSADSNSDPGSVDRPLPHTSPSQIRRRSERPAAREAHTGRVEADTGMDVVVPRWQPDNEVAICPICNTQFSFWVRKHHCRKCGRVVCSSCSPHRITIPHPYIVQPLEWAGSISGTGHESNRGGEHREAPGLEGGERVRLCNPCVPDPNTAPPQTPPREAQRRLPHHGRSASALSTTTLSPRPSRDSRASFHQHTSQPNIQGSPYRSPPANANIIPGGSHLSIRQADTANLESRSRSSTVGASRQYRDMDRVAALSGPPDRHGGRENHRRVIAEADECPICGKELPSTTLPNAEQLRSQHVSSCIESRIQELSGSPRIMTAAQGTSRDPDSLPAHPTPQEFRRSRGGRRQTESPTLPTPATPEGRIAARERAHAAVVFGASGSGPRPVRRTGVFPYKATEKDCIDDAECTICLEEFEVGVEMGRLECFCRFHMRCIREWFGNKPGQCPVHQHGAGY